MIENVAIMTIIYTLVIVLLIVLIVLGIKSIFAINTLNDSLKDINKKLHSFDGLFDFVEKLGNTLLIAFCSAVVSTILGTLGAIGAHYSKKKSRKLIETMTQLPVVNAEIVMALSLAVLVVALSMSFSFLTLLIGHVVLTIGFVYLNVKPKLTQMDPFTYEAALDLGAKPRYALYKVILPEILPGIISGFMISITLSLDDFVITQYLKEPSFETISTYIQKIIAKHPIPPEVRALATLIFLAVLLVVVGNTIYTNRKSRITPTTRKRGGK